MKTEGVEKLLKLHLEHVAAHVDRVLRDKGMSNKEVNDAIMSTPEIPFTLLGKAYPDKTKKV